jgi:membrane protease YdiL (CAAX protease family)
LQAVAEPLVALAVSFLLILALSMLLLPQESADRPDPAARAHDAPSGSDFLDLVQERPRMVPRFLAVQAAVFLLIGFLLIRWRVEPRPSETRWDAPRAVLLGLGGGVAAVVASAVLSLLLTFAGWPVQEQAWIQELLGEPRLVWSLAPWIVLVAPVAEEVFFRGYMLRFMERRLGFRAGLLLSSVVFAAIHLNPSGLPVYMVIAMVMALVYRRSRNLLSPIVAHATLNGTVLLAGASLPPSGTLPW